MDFDKDGLAPDHQAKVTKNLPISHPQEGDKKFNTLDTKGEVDGTDSLLYPSLQSQAPWFWKNGLCIMAIPNKPKKGGKSNVKSTELKRELKNLTSSINYNRNSLLP